MDKEILSKELLLYILRYQEEDQNLDDHNRAIIGDRLKTIVPEVKCCYFITHQLNK